MDCPRQLDVRETTVSNSRATFERHPHADEDARDPDVESDPPWPRGSFAVFPNSDSLFCGILSVSGQLGRELGTDSEQSICTQPGTFTVFFRLLSEMSTGGVRQTGEILPRLQRTCVPQTRVVFRY